MRPEGLFALSGSEQKCVLSPPADRVDLPPPNKNKTAEPAIALESAQQAGQRLKPRGAGVSLG
jgi:hypothetical protein